MARSYDGSRIRGGYGSSRVPFARRVFFQGGVSHSAVVSRCVRAQDVSIVRQLLETFVVASREARSLLLPEITQSGATFAWKAEDAPRLFDPPGNGTLRHLEEAWVGVCVSCYLWTHK